MTYKRFLEIIAPWLLVSETDMVAGRYRGRVSCAVTADKYGPRLKQLALPFRRVTRATDCVTVVR
jgi:hypothetical protein